ncbi:hypothetical protein [Sediminibacter sp. Hel_I_10]|uniref:hypothetical protein n=1 Tax=Sediminibacter sp. Hel_I_10 TaxID=1392490 RepID=UPI0004790ECA|nr:hypothetical protein [Sediminibacter sp. Hel_I_10]
MKKVSITIVFVLSCCFATMAQEAINNYKYIIIPTKFDFLKSKDQYQINSLAKFLFNKYGYTAFMSDEDYPADLNANRCLALTANVDEVKGGFLKTKMQIKLLDCNDHIIAESEVGETRIKEYEKAYNVGLREAFKTFQYFDYEYQPDGTIVDNEISVANNEPKKVSDPKNTNAQQEIERLKQEVETLKKSQENAVEKVAVAKETIAESKSADQVKLSAVKDEDVSFKGALYAQPMENGFQVVDTEPKKVMFLLKTSLTDVFKVEGKDALVYKKDGNWIYETPNGGTPKQEMINLKF